MPCYTLNSFDPETDLEGAYWDVLMCKSRLVYEQGTLRSFSKEIANFTQLPSLIDKAKSLIGLATYKLHATALARDVLNLTYMA